MQPVMPPQDNSDDATPGWLACINDACTERQVIDLINTYVATWTDEQVALIPNECKPRTVANGDDIASLAYRLVREECANFQTAPAIHRLATVFAVSTQRISQILLDARHLAESRAYLERSER
jgi:hypothetical protein